MDQQELVSWVFVILGLLVCLSAFAKGLLSLFVISKKDEKFFILDIDWGGIGIAVLIFVIGSVIIDLGFGVADGAWQTTNTSTR